MWAVVAISPGAAVAAEGSVDLLDAETDYSKATLRSGARTFLEQCLGCHSAKYYRYKGLVDDLGFSKATVQQEFLSGEGDIHSHMERIMSAEAAKQWFGVTPPDLSLVAHVRGGDWIYTYLLKYYRDPGTRFGWNNLVFPHTSMPNVLYGEAPEYYDSLPSPDSNGSEGEVTEHPEVPPELAYKVRSLVSFLEYIADPSIIARQSLGPYVLVFLLVLAVLTYLVKREYWRDIH